MKVNWRLIENYSENWFIMDHAWNFWKYSWTVVGKNWKNLDVIAPHKHARELWRRAHKIYTFPTALEHNFEFLLKSKNLKYFTTSPKIHSIKNLTSLIDLFQAFGRSVSNAVKWTPWKWSRRRYAGSPWMHKLPPPEAGSTLWIEPTLRCCAFYSPPGHRG